ncbi:MAG: hypothetical protein KDJ65_00705 [Anaerolineae bacterium]|nr:hypothetical protein [Anaerolineae bacterium]
MTMNNEPTFNQADQFDEALALLAAGLSMAEVLAEAGEDAVWLRPMLELAAEVDGLKPALAVPPPQPSLDRLLAHAETLTAPAPTNRPQPVRHHSAWPRFTLSRLLFSTGLSTAIAVTLLLFICGLGSLLGGGLVLAAEGSLPGQALYPIKRLSETIQLNVAPDIRQRQRLEETFNQRRLEEVDRLTESNETASVTITGRIEALTETSITINGVTLNLAPKAAQRENLVVGARVRIEGETNATGELDASTVTLLEPLPPTPTPTATSTPLPTATPLPPTATATPVGQSTSDIIKIIPTPLPSPMQDNDATDDDERDERDSDEADDNSGPGSNNSGSSNDNTPDEDNSGPGSSNSGSDDDSVPDVDNSGPGNAEDDDVREFEITVEPDNDNSGSSGSGSDDNSGSGSSGSDDDHHDDNSGSGSSNSGSDDDDDNSGKGGGDDDDDD